MTERQLVNSARAALAILLLAVVGNFLGLVPTPVIGALIMGGLLLSGWLLVSGRWPQTSSEARKRHAPEPIPDEFAPPEPQADAYVTLNDLRDDAEADDDLPLATLLDRSAHDNEARHE